jgi:hypothetical protein
MLQRKCLNSRDIDPDRLLLYVCYIGAVLPILFKVIGLTEDLPPPVPDQSEFARIGEASSGVAVAAFCVLVVGEAYELLDSNFSIVKDRRNWPTICGIIGWIGVGTSAYHFFSRPYSHHARFFCFSLIVYVVSWILVFWSYKFGNR